MNNRPKCQMFIFHLQGIFSSFNSHSESNLGKMKKDYLAISILIFTFGVKYATDVLRGPGWLHSRPRLVGQSTQNEIVGKFAGIETNDNGFQ